MKAFEFLFNCHAGEECIIIGNGPSLKDVPLSFLDSRITFGSNRIYLKFIPDYFVSVNALVMEQFRKEIQDLPCTKFLRERMGFDRVYNLHLVETRMFSYAPSTWLYDGCNVTFVSLQLAFFMGFTTVKLVGVDHRYDFDGKPNETLMMTEDDPNHFDPAYFKGSKWQAPDLKRSEEAYRMAKEAYEVNGRQVVNMTPGSALEVFKKVEPEWVP